MSAPRAPNTSSVDRIPTKQRTSTASDSNNGKRHASKSQDDIPSSPAIPMPEILRSDASTSTKIMKKKRRPQPPADVPATPHGGEIQATAEKSPITKKNRPQPLIDVPKSSPVEAPKLASPIMKKKRAQLSADISSIPVAEEPKHVIEKSATAQKKFQLPPGTPEAPIEAVQPNVSQYKPIVKKKKWPQAPAEVLEPLPVERSQPGIEKSAMNRKKAIPALQAAPGARQRSVQVVQNKIEEVKQKAPEAPKKIIKEKKASAPLSIPIHGSKLKTKVQDSPNVSGAEPDKQSEQASEDSEDSIYHDVEDIANHEDNETNEAQGSTGGQSKRGDEGNEEQEGEVLESSQEGDKNILKPLKQTKGVAVISHSQTSDAINKSQKQANNSVVGAAGGVKDEVQESSDKLQDTTNLDNKLSEAKDLPAGGAVEQIRSNQQDSSKQAANAEDGVNAKASDVSGYVDDATRESVNEANEAAPGLPSNNYGKNLDTDDGATDQVLDVNDKAQVGDINENVEHTIKDTTEQVCGLSDQAGELANDVTNNAPQWLNDPTAIGGQTPLDAGRMPKSPDKELDIGQVTVAARDATGNPISEVDMQELGGGMATEIKTNTQSGVASGIEINVVPGMASAMEINVVPVKPSTLPFHLNIRISYRSNSLVQDKSVAGATEG